MPFEIFAYYEHLYQQHQESINRQANVAQHLEQKESIYHAFMASIAVDHVKSSTRYIDSGASRHFTHRRDWFVEFTLYSNSVIFGGGEEYNIVSKGNVQIQSRGK